MTESRSHRTAEPWVAGIVLALTVLAIAAPILYLFYGSLQSAPPGAPGAHFTLDHWATVYASPQYLTSLKNTVLLSGTVAALSVLLGGSLAWILARTDAPGRRLLALMMIVPLMVSSLITALAWIALAAPNAGFMNALARAWLGIPTLFSIYSFGGIVLVFTLHFISFAFLPLYAALQSIDSSLEEASAMLGAGPARTAMRMTIPLIWPALVATFLAVFIFTAENFSVPILLGTNVGFHTLASLIYVDMAGDPANPSLGAAAGTLLLWIALLGSLWQQRISARGHRYVTMSGRGGQARVTALGRWRWAASAVVLLYLFFAILLPYLVLLLGSFLRFVTPRLTAASFTTANYTRLFAWDNLRPIENSLLLAGLGGLAATLFYFYLAFLLRRLPGPLRRLLDILVAVPTVIPALVLGVGLVWFLVGLPLPIYGTMAALMLAYATRFIGLGVRQAQAGADQIAGELTEAARLFGATPFRSFRDVSLPLLRPAAASLWTLLFILIFLEISVTVMLYTPDSMTLSVLLWSRMSAGNQTQAFAIAAVQASIVFLLLYLADRLFGTLRSTLDREPGRR